MLIVTPDSNLPDQAWIVFGWPTALIMIALALQALRGGYRLLLGFQCLFVGSGLALFMSYGHAWSHEWSCATWTIGFLLAGVLLLRKTGRHEFHELFKDQSVVDRLLLLVMLPVWVYVAYTYFTNSSIRDLPQEERLASIYNADPGCDVGALRRLARKPAGLTPLPSSTRQAEKTSICEVQWMQVNKKYWATASGPPCVDLLDAGQRDHYYCAFDFWDFRQSVRWRMYRGDLIVAQTVMGKASAFLRPPSELTDYVFSPRGEYVETVENPDHYFREHVWRAYWSVFFFLFAGGAMLVGLVR